MAPTDPPFFRYPIPQEICSCEHSLELHDISTRKQSCSTCKCGSFDPHILRWTERRVVDEVMP